MSGDLTKTLQAKINVLEQDKVTLREKISAIDGKLELLRELLGEVSGISSVDLEPPSAESDPTRRPARLKRSSSQDLRDLKDPQREALQEAIKEVTEQAGTNKLPPRDGVIRVSL